MAKTQCFLFRLPNDDREEFLAIRASFASGETGVSSRALARQIVADLTGRGIETTHEAVRSWLMRG